MICVRPQNEETPAPNTQDNTGILFCVCVSFDLFCFILFIWSQLTTISKIENDCYLKQNNDKRNRVHVKIHIYTCPAYKINEARTFILYFVVFFLFFLCAVVYFSLWCRCDATTALRSLVKWRKKMTEKTPYFNSLYFSTFILRSPFDSIFHFVHASAIKQWLRKFFFFFNFVFYLILFKNIRHKTEEHKK